MHPTLKIAIASAALAVAMTATVNAQSSSGNISGEAAAGDTVTATATGVDTGFKRELKIDKDGKYQIRRVPTGDYQVVRAHKDGTIDPVQGFVVRPGGTARVQEPGKADTKDASGS